MSMFTKVAGKRAARMVGFALTAGTSAGGLDEAAIFSARLTDEGRAGRVFAGLRSWNDDTRAKTAEAGSVARERQCRPFSTGLTMRVGGRAGERLGPCAYALATFDAMRWRARASQFLRPVNGGAIGRLARLSLTDRTCGPGG